MQRHSGKHRVCLLMRLFSSAARTRFFPVQPSFPRRPRVFLPRRTHARAAWLYSVASAKFIALPRLLSNGERLPRCVHVYVCIYYTHTSHDAPHTHVDGPVVSPLPFFLRYMVGAYIYIFRPINNDTMVNNA